MRSRWEIGFVSGGIEAVMSGKPFSVNYIKHNYKDRWFADPFILDINDTEIHLLVEEYLFSRPIGRISELTINRFSFELINNRTILELDTHLSFPAILRRNNHIFIYPESWTTQKVTVYDITDTIIKGSEPTPIKVILTESVADSIITNILGSDMLFTTKDNKTLLCYDISAECAILKDTYSFDNTTARNAGNFFSYNGAVYRPAQICAKRYGEAVEIQRVNMIGEKLSFSPILSIRSHHNALNLGLHTFNTYKNEVVIDVYGYEKPWFAKPSVWIKEHIMGKNWHRNKK